jgi:hypothetical protein
MYSLWFHVVEILPKWEPFNATNHLEHILQLILELHPESVRDRLVIHTDNVRSHMAGQSREFCKQNFLKIALYSFCSPDLAPSDFFIRVCEALCERTFLSFGKSTSWRNSHSLKGNLRNHFEGHVQGLNGETSLDCRTRKSLLSIK